MLASGLAPGDVALRLSGHASRAGFAAHPVAAHVPAVLNALETERVALNSSPFYSCVCVAAGIG